MCQMWRRRFLNDSIVNGRLNETTALACVGGDRQRMVLARAPYAPGALLWGQAGPQCLQTLEWNCALSRKRWSSMRHTSAIRLSEKTRAAVKFAPNIVRTVK
jgi:hypothetical protein